MYSIIFNNVPNFLANMGPLYFHWFGARIIPFPASRWRSNTSKTWLAHIPGSVWRNFRNYNNSNVPNNNSSNNCNLPLFPSSKLSSVYSVYSVNSVYSANSVNSVYSVYSVYSIYCFSTPCANRKPNIAHWGWIGCKILLYIFYNKHIIYIYTFIFVPGSQITHSQKKMLWKSCRKSGYALKPSTRHLPMLRMHFGI